MDNHNSLTINDKDKNKNKNIGNNTDSSTDKDGFPLPLADPNGGPPTCTSGYKIDYNYDPFNDEIDPLFNCISSLKDPDDGIAGKILEMANNTSSGVENIMTSRRPLVVGGRRLGRRLGHKRKTRTKRRSRVNRTRVRRSTHTHRTRRTRRH